MIPQELVISRHGQPITTSLIVAEAFEKKHLHVLRTIRDLGCSPGFTESNFGFSEYTDPSGRTLPMYHITRDGFAILVMGFTGQKAMVWKERFIAAFNDLSRRAAVSRAMLPRHPMLERLKVAMRLYDACEREGEEAMRHYARHNRLSARQTRDYVAVGRAFWPYLDPLVAEADTVERIAFNRFVVLARVDPLHFAVVDGRLHIGPWTLADVAGFQSRHTLLTYTKSYYCQG